MPRRLFIFVLCVFSFSVNAQEVKGDTTILLKQYYGVPDTCLHYIYTLSKWSVKDTTSRFYAHVVTKQDRQELERQKKAKRHFLNADLSEDIRKVLCKKWIPLVRLDGKFYLSAGEYYAKELTPHYFLSYTMEVDAFPIRKYSTIEKNHYCIEYLDYDNIMSRYHIYILNKEGDESVWIRERGGVTESKALFCTVYQKRERYPLYVNYSSCDYMEDLPNLEEMIDPLPLLRAKGF